MRSEATAMRQCMQVLVLTLLMTVLLSSPTWATKKKCPVRAKLMKKRGVILTCSSAGPGGGRIASLSVHGEAGQCQGLTASMFVQVNSCLWKAKCTLKKDPHDEYLVKLYRGTPADCITRKPTCYRITYHCANANVPVIDMPAAGKREEVKEEKGVVRSHEDHPWLYSGHGGTNQTVTLVNPTSNSKAFVYTILTLKLYNDVLTVRPGDGRNDGTRYTDDVTTWTTDVIKGVKTVTFQLEMSRHSIGGEGFVFCFQWVTELKAGEDACTGLVSPGVKPRKGKKTRRKEKIKDGKKKTNKIRKEKKKREREARRQPSSARTRPA